MVAVLVAAGCVGSAAMAATLDGPFEATCRITNPQRERGTGVVFEVGNGLVYVLTCGHVVGDNPHVQLEFWRAGHQSPAFAGAVQSKSTTADAAIVTVPLARFGGVSPRVIPLAARGTVLGPGEAILSAGCAGGSWATAFEGHVLGYDAGDLVFRPAPANGRSGSAILSADGSRIVGLVRARAMDDSHGRAVSVEALYAAFGASDVQCPDGQCGPQYRMERQYSGPLGAQYRVQREIGPSWANPGRPAPAPSPWNGNPYAGPTDTDPFRDGYAARPAQIDLSPLEQRLDRNDETMRNGFDRLADLMQRKEEPPMPSTPPPDPRPVVPVEPGDPPIALPPAVPPAPVELVDEEARRQAAEAQAEASGLRGLVERAVGDRDTLQARFEERLAKVQAELGENATKVDTAKAYARDLVAEKLAGKLSDGSAGLTIGKIAAGTLGISGPLGAALVAAAWLASRRMGKRIRRRLADGSEEIEENP